MVNDKSCKDDEAKSMAIAEHEEVEVVICQPGDTMIFRPCDAHSVFTVFPVGTPDSAKWAILEETGFPLDCCEAKNLKKLSLR